MAQLEAGGRERLDLQAEALAPALVLHPQQVVARRDAGGDGQPGLRPSALVRAHARHSHHLFGRRTLLAHQQQIDLRSRQRAEVSQELMPVKAHADGVPGLVARAVGEDRQRGAAKARRAGVAAKAQAGAILLLAVLQGGLHGVLDAFARTAGEDTDAVAVSLPHYCASHAHHGPGGRREVGPEEAEVDEGHAVRGDLVGGGDDVVEFFGHSPYVRAAPRKSAIWLL